MKMSLKLACLDIEEVKVKLFIYSFSVFLYGECFKRKE